MYKGYKNSVKLLFRHISLVFVAVVLSGYFCVSVAQTFTDQADSYALSAIPNSLQYGSGFSFYDFDRDGWDDLSFTMVDDSIRFYRNLGGTFELLPPWLYGEGQVKHLVWVDYDNDSDLDLAVTAFHGQVKLYRNDSDFSFTDVSVEAGLMQAYEKYYGITFADYDRDGDLDFYVVCYEMTGNESNYSRLNHLYQNNGDGTFTDVTLEAGVGDGIRLSFKGVWLDYNKDGWPDLFVINDRVFQNSLYKNNGDGTFTDVSEEAGIQLGGQDPMTASVADFDHDGDLDIYMTNTSSPLKRGQLLVNQGNGTFDQLAADYGVDVFGWTWGAVWADYDNDTDQDLYVATGHPTGDEDQLKNYLLENHNGIYFTDVSDSEMENVTEVRSYSVARGDFNNDGYYDMGVLNRVPNNLNLWENSGNENNFIKITLSGTASNTMAIGSWIKVFIDGMQYTQYTMCGENYIAQNSQHHIFGLRDATFVDSVHVEYVLGHTDKYYNLSANQHYYFTEGDTYHASISYSNDLALCQNDSIILDAGEHHQYIWNNGYDGRYLTVSDSGDFWVQVQNEFGVTAQSDTVSVEVYELPYPEPIVIHPGCYEESSGSITLNNLTGGPAAEVVWEHGAEGEFLDSLTAGTYYYNFIDTNGCSATGSAFLMEPMPLNLLVFVFPEVFGDDGSISLVINGGVPPYIIWLDSVQVEIPISGLAAGNYLLTIMDQNGCEIAEEVIIDSTTSISSISKESGSIFPNPAICGTSLKVQLPDAVNASDMIILNTSGQVLQKVEVNEQLQQQIISTAGIAAGQYMLQIKNINGSEIYLPFVLVQK